MTIHIQKLYVILRRLHDLKSITGMSPVWCHSVWWRRIEQIIREAEVCMLWIWRSMQAYISWKLTMSWSATSLWSKHFSCKDFSYVCIKRGENMLRLVERRRWTTRSRWWSWSHYQQNCIYHSKHVQHSEGTSLFSSFILHIVTYTHLHCDRNGVKWWIVMPASCIWIWMSKLMLCKRPA